MKFIKLTGYEGDTVYVAAERIVRIIDIRTSPSYAEVSSKTPNAEKAHSVVEYDTGKGMTAIGVIEKPDEVLAQIAA